MHSEADPQQANCPFRLDRCGDLAPLRRALEEAGYNESAVSELVLLNESGKPLDLNPVLRRTQEPTAFNTLLRLFVLGRTVPEAAARDALAPAEIEPLVDLGLLIPSAEGVRAEAALMDVDGLWMLRDFWPDFVDGKMAPDHIPGVGPASQTAARLTVRRQGEAALDLGTGSGFLALLAARHAKSVIGTDTNARALNFAALNARLNEISGIELRRGSLYEPVADCRFDLIVVNPPFAISPGASYEYRDGGLTGDAISEGVIRQAAPLLAEGGYSSVMFNWHHQNEEDWAQRPRQWVADNGCDAWLICTGSTDPVTYACSWLNAERDDDADRFTRTLDEWLAYYRQLGIGRLSAGGIVMRRRSNGSNWFRSEKVPSGQPATPCSDQIQRIFAAEDLLRNATADGDLLGMRFRLTADHQLQHTLKMDGGKWLVKHACVKQSDGFEFLGNVDQLVSTVLAGCDGRHTVEELATDLAAALGADLQQILPSCIGMVRTLLGSGFLEKDEG